MPFTLSHPAIILPFLKNKKVSQTALVVGSMSPDFVYFFRMKLDNDISHTFNGILLVDLPLGLIAMFSFHQIIKNPLIENLPVFFQKRLAVLKNANWIAYFKTNVLIVLLSFYIGAVTHLFLDSFVHSDGYFVERISFLENFFFGFKLFEIAQYFGSFIGLVFIAHYFYTQPAKTAIIYKPTFKYWFLSFGISALIFGSRLLYDLPKDDFGKLVATILFSAITAITIASLFTRKKQTI